MQAPEAPVSWPAADPSSPFFCHGPTLISFSGGETSALMLFKTVEAHGGVLPDYVIVAFANTGLELEETYRFVHECGVRWGVYIHWVEWRPAGARTKNPRNCEHSRKGRCDDCKRSSIMAAASRRFERVGFNSADREGKWFAELIRRKHYLPNQDMRYCTEKLKIETMKWLMVSLGFDSWLNMVGLRADEKHRVMKQVLRNASGKERYISFCPLAVAGITKFVVERFWHGALGRFAMVASIRARGWAAMVADMPRGFVLGLFPYEGNCDFCFLKGRSKKMAMLRAGRGNPGWWREQERQATATTFVRTSYAKRFDKNEDFDQLVAAEKASPMLEIDETENDAECGVTCVASDGDEPVSEGAWRWMVERLQEAAATPIEYKAPKAPPVHYGDLLEGL